MWNILGKIRLYQYYQKNMMKIVVNKSNTILVKKSNFNKRKFTDFSKGKICQNDSLAVLIIFYLILYVGWATVYCLGSINYLRDVLGAIVAFATQIGVSYLYYSTYHSSFVKESLNFIKITKIPHSTEPTKFSYIVKLWIKLVIISAILLSLIIYGIFLTDLKFKIILCFLFFIPCYLFVVYLSNLFLYYLNNK